MDLVDYSKPSNGGIKKAQKDAVLLSNRNLAYLENELRDALAELQKTLQDFDRNVSVSALPIRSQTGNFKVYRRDIDSSTKNGQKPRPKDVTPKEIFDSLPKQEFLDDCLDYYRSSFESGQFGRTNEYGLRSRTLVAQIRTIYFKAPSGELVNKLNQFEYDIEDAIDQLVSSRVLTAQQGDQILVEIKKNTRETRIKVATKLNKLSELVGKEAKFVSTRKEFYINYFDKRRKKDYYSQVRLTIADADPANRKYDPVKEKANVEDRRVKFNARVTQLESTPIRTIEEITKLQEEFVLPRFAVEELKNTGYLSPQTAQRLRDESDRQRGQNIPINYTSVLSTESTPKSRVPKEWKTYRATSENDVVVPSSQFMGVVIDTGDKGREFNEEIAAIYFNMAEAYKKRVIEADKKRIEIAEILWQKLNGSTTAVPDRQYLEFSLVGKYTIADDIALYLERKDLSDSERTKMMKLRVDLGKMIVGELDELYPEKGPLLKVGLKLREMGNSLGYGDIKFDFADKNEPAEAGAKRESVFDIGKSIDAQAYKTLGRQYIKDDDKVSQFVFDVDNNEAQVLSHGWLRSSANDLLLQNSVQVQSSATTTPETRLLRRDTGSIDKEAWKALVNDGSYATIKDEVENAFQQDIYRQYAIRELKDSWRTDFRNRLLVGLGKSESEINQTRVVALNNIKYDPVSGANLGEFSNIDLIADLTLEAFAKEYAAQVVGETRLIRSSRGLSDISKVDPRELFDKIQRKFDPSTGLLNRSTFELSVEKSLEEAFELVKSIKNGNVSGFYSPLKKMAIKEIESSIKVIGKEFILDSLVPSQSNAAMLKVNSILPISTLKVTLLDPTNPANAGMLLGYKERRLVNYDGTPNASNIQNCIAVDKEVFAREQRSAHQLQAFNAVSGVTSVKMARMLNDDFVVIEKGGSIKIVPKVQAEIDSINAGTAKQADQTRSNVNNLISAWLIGTESADIAMKAYGKEMGKQSSLGVNILDPEKFVTALLTDERNLGFGTRLQRDFFEWTIGPTTGGFIDPNKFRKPDSKIDPEKYYVDRQRKMIQDFRELIPILGPDASKGIFGHVFDRGEIPGLALPIFDKVIFGDYEGKGIKLITDLAGKNPLGVKAWQTNRVQHLLGMRAVIDGNDVNVMGYKILNGYEKQLDKVVNSRIGKYVKLGKNHTYEKRQKRSLVREVGSIVIDIGLGYAKMGLINLGNGIMGIAPVGRVLRSINDVTHFVENTSKTLGALKAIRPIAQSMTVGATYSALSGIPAYLLVGGGPVGIVIGVGVGGIVGGGKALQILSNPATSKAIEEFMGFERLNNLALNETYLVRAGEDVALRTYQGVGAKLKLSSGFTNTEELFRRSKLIDIAADTNSAYIRFLSPDGWYGKQLTKVYKYLNDTNVESRLLANIPGEGTAVMKMQSALGMLGRTGLVGAGLYAFAPFGVTGAILGGTIYGGLEWSARRLLPSVAVKLQFLGETAVGRNVANALTKVNDFRVHFPLLDTLGLVQSSLYFNDMIAIPTYHLLRGNMPLNIYLGGGTARMNLFDLSLGEAKALGVSEKEYFTALEQSRLSGYISASGGKFSLEIWGNGNAAGYDSFLKSGGDLDKWANSDPVNYNDYMSKKSAYESGKWRVPQVEYYYQGLLTAPTLAGIGLYLGVGYLPVVSAYSSAMYTLSTRMGINNIWGGWFANRLQTIPENSILGWMKNSRGLTKIAGDFIDNPFGALPQGVRTVATRATYVAGTAAGGYGGYLAAVALGVTNPFGIGLFVAGGAGLGFASTSLVMRGAGYLWNNVVTGWLRVPLAAAGGWVGYVSPLLGGAVGGAVAQLAGFGTVGTWFAVGAGTVVGAILIPGIGGVMGFAVGTAAAAGASYVSGYVGDMIGAWWNKTTGYIYDGVSNIAPLLALIRVFNSLNRADLGGFMSAVFQFGLSFSVGIAATGVVLTAVVPPLVTPGAAPLTGGTYIAPFNKLITKQFISYDKTTKKLKYQINVNAAVVGITESSIVIELKDIPEDPKSITFLTDGECAQFNGEFKITSNQITLTNTKFDGDRVNKNICLEYEVEPAKDLATYKQFCNIFSADVKDEQGEPYPEIISDGGVQCVSPKGQNLGINNFQNEGYTNDQSIPPTGNPVQTGTGFFPVDPNDQKVGGCQCPYGGNSHTAGGMIDICGADGTPVMAWQDGKVMSVAYYSYNSYIYGLMIMIKHANGIETWYAHLATAVVKGGDEVKGGQVIGTMGASTGTGNSGMYTHLHFETRSDPSGTSPNPCIEMLDCKKYKVTSATSHISCFLDQGGTPGRASGAMYSPSAWRHAYAVSLTPPRGVVQPNVHPFYSWMTPKNL
jgi:hypothetical protein